MTRFDRYFLSQLLVLFGFFSLVLVAIYWINRAVALFDQLISDGQSAGTVLVFTALSLPAVIRAVLPLAAFAAAIYVTNRLSDESEIVVVQASGFSPWRTARAVVVFAIFVFGFMSVLSHILEPASREELSKREQQVANDLTARFLNPGEFLHPTLGVTFYLRNINPNGVLEGVYLDDRRRATSQTTYIAREALIVPGPNGPTLVMVDGSAQTYNRRSERLALTRFSDFAFDIERLTDKPLGPRIDPRQLSTAALFAADPADIERTFSTRATFIYEAHDRLVQPLLAAVAALLGFSVLTIGSYSRFGVWRQVIGAIFLLIILKSIDNAMANLTLGDERLWPLLYVPSLIGALLVGGMMWLNSKPRRVSTTAFAEPAE
ncbi:MAG: LPS export ABC transporter permease LptF [Pseudomonadota bacterium]